MKDNKNIICAVIISIGICIAGLLISSALTHGFDILRAAISYAGELSSNH